MLPTQLGNETNPNNLITLISMENKKPDHYLSYKINSQRNQDKEILETLVKENFEDP